eukprot:s837_g22.t1
MTAGLPEAPDVWQQRRPSRAEAIYHLRDRRPNHPVGRSVCELESHGPDGLAAKTYAGDDADTKILGQAWRRKCLKCHPDKQPEGLDEEAAAEWTAQFQAAVGAFEAIDRHRQALEPQSEPEAA